MSPLVQNLRSELHAPTGPRAERLHTALRELAALDETLARYAEENGLRTADARISV